MTGLLGQYSGVVFVAVFLVFLFSVLFALLFGELASRLWRSAYSVQSCARNSGRWRHVGYCRSRAEAVVLCTCLAGENEEQSYRAMDLSEDRQLLMLNVDVAVTIHEKPELRVV